MKKLESGRAITALTHIPGDAGGNTGYDCVRGDILGDHGARADQSFFAHGNASHDGGVCTDRCPGSNSSLYHLPILRGLQASVRRDRPGIDIVYEHDTMADENAVLDFDPLANERVAGNLAVAPDARAFLNFYKRPNLGAISYGATVEIHQLWMENFNALPQHNGVGDHISPLDCWHRLVPN
jgi:hypothetical protein